MGSDMGQQQQGMYDTSGGGYGQQQQYMGQYGGAQVATAQQPQQQYAGMSQQATGYGRALHLLNYRQNALGCRGLQGLGCRGLL